MPWDDGSREVARKWKLVGPEEKQQWKDEADRYTAPGRGSLLSVGVFRERLKWEATPEGMAIMRGEIPVQSKATKSSPASKRKRQQHK